MSLTSSPGRTEKFEFFHWLTKNDCAAEMKIRKLYASHFTSGPDDRNSLARFTKKNRTNRTNGDHFWSIRRNRKSFCVNKSSTSPATMSFSAVIIVFCCSGREGEKKRLKLWDSTSRHNDYFVADHTPRNHKIKFESAVGFKKHLSCFKKSSREKLKKYHTC